MMKNYELTYLISPDLSEEESKVFQEKIASRIQEEEGILNEVRPPAIKSLSYPIKKKWSAYLTWLGFQLAPEKLENLEKKLKQEAQILRYLLLMKPVSEIREVVVPARKPRLRAALPKIKKPEVKVELKEIEKKLEEILGE